MAKFYRRVAGNFVLTSAQALVVRDLVRNFVPGIPANQVVEVVISRRPNLQGGVEVHMHVIERVLVADLTSLPLGQALEEE